MPLSGGMLWVAAMVLAAANFIAVLNLTLANVSVPSIAGSLGATTSQGIWVITSFAVGEAITVPLTGWLARRLGACFRQLIAAVFTLFSALSGVSTTLGLLVVARIFQGFAAGPLMPLSQTLLLASIFPREKAAVAIAIWSMTTTIAPVLGPILGGYLCDEYSWHWVFFLNTPIAIGCAFIGWNLLQRYTDPLSKNPIDRVGLVLLVVWVAALQLMLDEGKGISTGLLRPRSSPWRSLPGVVGFIAFLIWEIHEEHPVVDLRIFRHRGFSATVLTICLAFAAYFSINVLTPLWLQSFMGYTATIAGQATAWTGCFALFYRAHRRATHGPYRSASAGVFRRAVDGRGDAVAFDRHHRHGLLGRCHAPDGARSGGSLLLHSDDGAGPCPASRSTKWIWRPA